MINQKELRIGNLALFCQDIENQEIFRDVVEIHGLRNGRDFLVSYVDGKNHILTSSEILLHPTPITPEWLERFGFTRERNLFRVVQSEEVFYLARVKDSCFLWQSGVNERTIKHVHQLQNLFFALTGEELKMKE